MSHKTNIYEFARKGITNGINICRRAVEGTIGGKGTNAIIRQEFYPFYIQTKDAFSIIQAIRCEDPLEKQAVDMMKDATDSMNKRSKDGRTTMCILTDEILQESEKSGKSGLVIERELAELLSEIEKVIDTQTRPITVDEVEAVATTAADSPRLGKLIAGIYQKAGKDCIINHIEASGTFEDDVQYTEGVHFTDTGFLSPYMVRDEEARKEGRTEKKAIYEKPAILITKRKIQSDDDIAPLVEALMKYKRDLVIFTNDMDSGVATNLVNTHKAHNDPNSPMFNKLINICIVKAPTLWPQYVFEDFAKCTGATIVEDASGITFKNLALDHLGSCGKITVDREEVIIEGTADIREHVAELKALGDEDSLRRVWWLTTKTATIRLGANNEGELSFLRLKTEDAIHSSQLALNHGIVAGGGVALLNVAGVISNPIIKKALEGPARQIRKNAGLPEVNYLYGGKDIRGLDAKTGEDVDMFKAGIVDSAIVVKNAVRNAIAIASRVLTTNVLIDIPRRSPEELQLEILSKRRTPF